MGAEPAVFAGGIQRSGPLQSGLGQLEWLSYQSGGHGALPNLVWDVAVPEGLPDDAVEHAVSTLLRRHDVLRTSFDADDDGRPRQNVHEDVHVTFVRLEDEDSRRAFADRPFDIATRPPIRFGRAPSGDLVVGICHIAVDGTAAWMLVRELDELLTALHQGRPADLADDVPRPIDQALYERGTGRRRAEAALQHWGSALRDVPVSVLPVGRGRPGADVVRADLDSLAASLALTRLHATLKATPASIFTAAAYWALAIQFGRDRLALGLTWSFRELPTTRLLVAAVFRDMPLMVDLGDCTSFTEVLRRLQRSVLVAGRHMGFDVLEFHECVARLEAERGAFLPGPEAISVTFHDVALEQVEPDVDLRDLLPRSRTTVYRTAESWDVCNLYVGASTVDGRLLIEARLDGSVMQERDSAQLATSIEAILVHAAAHGDLTRAQADALTAGPPRPRTRSARIGEVDVDLDLLTERLLGHPAVERADVRAEHGRLTADVTANLEPWQLRDLLLSADSGRTAVMSPDRFVVRRPDGRVVTGSGVDRPVLAPEGPAETALRDAVAQANGLAAPTMAGTYLGVGGRLHLAPRVLSLLRDGGWAGLTVADLRRPTSLVTLSGRLRQDG
ncbi:condensation domain-containing protein [Cellulomonas xiejunii]|uniref:Condensation domain-containing protein n=1 Tax=Cellulomonas xiejunii TaxID=2968083 RepID=A0ABY5KPU4_9CELL|nr:condensation domain-containing protein [Cellulomonas xiejunii]MCC2321233.1 condensation domain-containing protein [Cellulomonas xiejunii]UUI71820.1 condensation domain-containing protein [Cellulomonas xiejunii]